MKAVMVPGSSVSREASKIWQSTSAPLRREQWRRLDDRRETVGANVQRPNRAIVILAGGPSSRFGSKKALQTLAGKPLIRHVVERLSGVADEVLVVVGRGEATAEYCAALPSFVRVINDELEGKTPLVGIVAGLQAAKSDYAAILSCDIPFVSTEVIKLLFRRASNADAAIPRWNQERIEALEAVYRRVPTLRAARETLALPDLPLTDMIRRLDQVVYVSVQDEIRKIDSDLTTFFNVNTREDMATAEKMLTETSLNFEHARVKRNSEGAETS